MREHYDKFASVSRADVPADTFRYIAMSDFRYTQKVLFTTIDVSEMYRLPRYTLDYARDRSTRNPSSKAINGHQRYPSRTPKFCLQIRRLVQSI